MHASTELKSARNQRHILNIMTGWKTNHFERMYTLQSPWETSKTFFHQNKNKENADPDQISWHNDGSVENECEFDRNVYTLAPCGNRACVDRLHLRVCMRVGFCRILGE